MKIRLQDSQQQETLDQWDGTDIEPGHPRNTGESKPKDPDFEYFRQYSSGDRFS